MNAGVGLVELNIHQDISKYFEVFSPGAVIQNFCFSAEPPTCISAYIFRFNKSLAVVATWDIRFCPNIAVFVLYPPGLVNIRAATNLVKSGCGSPRDSIARPGEVYR